jgi:hypothetical protein
MQEKYYLTVDECPLIAWRKGNDGDFTHLRKVKGKYTNEDDLKAWELLYNDYIKVIGLSQDFKLYIELVKAKNEATIEYLTSELNGTRNRFLLNKINIIDGQIRELQNKSGVGLTVSEVLPILSKAQGFHLKEKDLTVLEYHNYIKTLK